MEDVAAAALLWLPFLGLLWYYRRGLAEVPADQYEHELPTGLKPAVVGILFGAQRFAIDSAATTLDLVCRGVLHLGRLPAPRAAMSGDPLAHDHLLVLDPERVAELDDIEKGLVDFLFTWVAGGAKEVRISQVRHWWSTHPGVAHSQEISWERRATAIARYYRLVAPRASGGASAGAYYGVILCVVGLLFATALHPLARLSILLCGMAMVALVWRLPSLTQRGIDLRRRYQGFHNYLHDFGRFHDKEAEQIVLWDYYLAYAVTLGLATESLWELFIVPPPIGEGTTAFTLQSWLHLRPLPPVWTDQVPERAVSTQRAAAEALAGLRPTGVPAARSATGWRPASAATAGAAAATSGRLGPAVTGAAGGPAAAAALLPVGSSAASTPLASRAVALPRAPPSPHQAPPPSTYEANEEATKKAITRVAGCAGFMLFGLPLIVIVLVMLLIGCQQLGKIT
jgi:hypothetical protein